MKRFLTFALACFPLMCIGAPSISYTTYFNNTHTYTNSTTAGTNSASRGVFTNGITAGASTFTGAVGFADGSATAPSIGWTSDADGTGTGLYRSAANNVDFTVNGTRVFNVSGSSIFIPVDALPLVFGASGDTIIRRDGAANTLALRNGANAQLFHTYNTFTDASNYERIRLGFSGNTAVITTESAGTGTARNMIIGTQVSGTLTFRTGGSSRWVVDANGHLTAGTDNTYDIGASGATRPRDIFIVNRVRTDGTFQAHAGVGSGVQWGAPSEGVLFMRNFAGTDFNRFQFGGTTTNFNAIAAVTNVAGKPYLKFTDATGANLRKIVNVGHQGGYTNVLSDAVATSVFYIAVPSTNIVAGKVVYEIAATDGTDTQGISGECKFVAVGKSTTVTAQIADVQTTAAASAGTLTTSVAANVATNNVLAITIDANTSLTTTNLVAKWRVESAGLFDVNQVIP